MVNHLYTLLVNLPAYESFELIDPSFSPNILSDEQASIRNQVFPQDCTHEYMSFIARGIVRLCESSSLWSLFLEQDSRQPIFKNDISVSDLIRSISITLDPGFIQSVNEYSSYLPGHVSQSAENNFIVSQEYIKNLDGTTIIGAYGIYNGNPEMGVFQTSWGIRKESNYIFISNQSDITQQVEIPITYEQNGSVLNISSELPGERQMSIRISGPSIPDGFNCTITAKNPMTYSYEQLYSRISTSASIETLLAVNDKELAQTLFSMFWSKDSLHDAIAASMIAYTYSLK
jgi:hypothetical protein